MRPERKGLGLSSTDPPGRWRVLIADHVSGDLSVERSVLDPLGVELVLAPSTDAATLVELAADTQVLATCFAQITEPVIEAAAAAGCRLIARYGIGVDNIDLAAAARAGIAVTNVPDYCLNEVADHTMALVLAAVRRLPVATDAVARDGWSFATDIHRLQGQRMVLLGYGRIGHLVAARAAAFGFEVTVFDPAAPARSDDSVVYSASLADAVGEADVVSLHMPLTPETMHVVDAELIAAMRRAPALINTSRGALIDSEAAIVALDEGRLSWLALDVTEPEPLALEDRLRTHSRATITAHSAYYSVEAQLDLCGRVAEEVARALTREQLRDPIDLFGVA